MPLGVLSEASCMASPRCCTSRRPDSKSITPAKTRAVYSPRLRPAAASHCSIASGDSLLQLLQRRQTGDEDARLAVDGGVQLLGGTFEAEASQVVAEDAFCRVVEFAGRRQALVEVSAHADRWAPWPGKRNAILMRYSCGSTTTRPM